MGAPEIGELLEGKYKIERIIGEGAWGEVLEATNVRIKRRVAIKILKQQYASNPQMVGRFEREALASTHIESPHVVQIFDAGVLGDGRPYMVMEFLVGDDLGKRIENAKNQRLPIVDSIGFCIQAARGLGAAHTAGIFHRDMKPSNIVIAKTKSGRELAKIVDFGISKLLNDQDGMSNTQTGTIMGSPVYMSPEQARGAKTTDQRSDIYSLGVVLYECVTGRTPFVADSFNELLFKIALEEAPAPKTLRADIDDNLNDIILKAMARAPEARFQTAAEFESALIGWLQQAGDAASDWLTDTGGRGLDLAASPTRGKSIPEILVASPLGQSTTPTAPVAVKETGANEAVRDTSTSLSKTADEAKSEAAKPQPSSKKFVYIGAAAALLVVGIIGASKLGGGNTTDTKPDVKQATSNVVPQPTTPPSVPAVDTAKPTPSDSAATTAATPDASTADTTPAPTTKPVIGGGLPRPHPTATPTAKPTGTPTPPPSGTSVGGRTIRTDF